MRSNIPPPSLLHKHTQELAVDIPSLPQRGPGVAMGRVPVRHWAAWSRGHCCAGEHGRPCALSSLSGLSAAALWALLHSPLALSSWAQALPWTR